MFWKKHYAVIILIFLAINYLLLYLMRHPKLEFVKTRQNIQPENVEAIKEHSTSPLPDLHMETDNISRELSTEEFSLPKFQIAVLVMACNRTSVTRCVDSILKARKNDTRFPVIVSQDCQHSDTEHIIKGYKDVLYMKQPNQTDPILEKKKAKLKGYFRIARHYRWALNQVFYKLKHSACIIIEDDLEVSPDIFEYFLATYPILDKDSHLYCVSAWNDNGKSVLIDSSKPGLIHRTDFFPGLGWMLLKKLWLELEPIWPDGFWDDWMRTPAIRRDRSCLRPEISRTETFGKKGVSNGMHYVAHLQYIKKYDSFYPFTKDNLSYVELDNYEEQFLRKVYLSREVPVEFLHGKKLNINIKESFRVIYTSKDDFKAKAKQFGIMFDFKSGIPRTAYRGIVPFMHLNRLIYLCPIYDWQGYNASWN